MHMEPLRLLARKGSAAYPIRCPPVLPQTVGEPSSPRLQAALLRLAQESGFHFSHSTTGGQPSTEDGRRSLQEALSLVGINPTFRGQTWWRYSRPEPQWTPNAAEGPPAEAQRVRFPLPAQPSTADRNPELQPRDGHRQCQTTLQVVAEEAAALVVPLLQTPQCAPPFWQIPESHLQPPIQVSAVPLHVHGPLHSHCILHPIVGELVRVRRRLLNDIVEDSADLDEWSFGHVLSYRMHPIRKEKLIYIHYVNGEHEEVFEGALHRPQVRRSRVQRPMPTIRTSTSPGHRSRSCSPVPTNDGHASSADETTTYSSASDNSENTHDSEETETDSPKDRTPRRGAH
jgi:hypothetical protein